MTTEPGAESAYDPADDPDADPANLNPRTGAAAGLPGDDEPDEDEDTDADPANLNPRSTLDEPE